MTTKDEWMRAAMADDTLVVELLVRLKQVHAMEPLKYPPYAAALPLLRWGIKQLRSRIPIRYEKKDDGDSARNSPTTPLSWSGEAASPLGTADCFEESSYPSNPCCGATRFKDGFNVESPVLSSKKSRKRKQLTLMHASIKEQGFRHKNLKRMKHDLKLHCDKSIVCDTGETSDHIVDGNEQRRGCIIDASSKLQRNAYGEDHLSTGTCRADVTVDKGDKCFVLPDLNMMASEEEFC